MGSKKKKKRDRGPDISALLALLAQQQAALQAARQQKPRIPTPQNSKPATDVAAAAEQNSISAAQNNAVKGRASTYLGFGNTSLAEDFDQQKLELL